MLTPTDGTTAPRNTRVRVAFFHGTDLPAVTLQRVTPVRNRVTPVRNRKGNRVTPVRRKGRKVAVRAHTRALSGMWVVELTPRRPLVPGATYEVMVGKRPVGSFVASKHMDVRAPTWAGVTAASYVVERPSATERTAGGSTIRIIRSESACFRPDPYAVLAIEPATDDIAQDDELLFAVWMPSVKGVLDPAASPTAYVTARDGVLALGSTSVCDPVRFAFPRAKSLTLAVAVIDAAGNETAPVEVTLDLARPVAQAPAR